jgi:hypothetical protein
VLAAISLLALGLRVWHLDYGLPGVFNMDERPILDRALTFAKGDPNPHNFLYPTLYLYAIFAWEALYFVVGRGLGWFSSLAAFQNAFFVDASGHVLAARLLTALLGAATVPAAYLFGRRVGGSGVGLAAALLLAVAPLAVRDAHYVKLDVPVTLLTTLALASLTRIAGEPEAAAPWRTWAAAGLLAGLAISTHYYAAILAVPFAAVAAADVNRSGRWQTSAELLIVAGLATIAGFVLGSPFFVLEPGVLVRDFTELRQVDIDRAVGSGLFSSIDTYGALLPKAMGWPTVVLGLVGILSMLWRDWRRALPLAVFPVAFMIFVANTFPASRYLNIVIPTGAVAAACGVAGLLRAFRRVDPSSFAAVVVLAAIPALVDSVRWDRFFGQPDTRTLAGQYIEQGVPAEATILVQPYSAPLRQSKDGLLEALRAHVGDEARAPIKFRLQLAATPYPSPAFRLLYLGEGGKTGSVPGDPDKVYVAPRAFAGGDGAALRAAGVRVVVLTRYGPTPPALVPLESVLRRDGRLVKTFSPYAPGVDAATADVPPFRHNSNTWIDGSLERPGPIVDVWQVD